MEIETNLLALGRLTQSIDTTSAGSSYARFFSQVLRCSTEASGIISAIRETARRINVGPETRRRVDLHLDGAEHLIYFAQLELQHIVQIMSQAGVFTPPTDIVDGSPECCVCQDPEGTKESGVVVLSHCGLPGARHCLCGGCFIEYFVQRGEGACPVCRHDYDTVFKPI